MERTSRSLESVPRVCHVVAGLTPENWGSQRFGHHASNHPSLAGTSLEHGSWRGEGRSECPELGVTGL